MPTLSVCATIHSNSMLVESVLVQRPEHAMSTACLPNARLLQDTETIKHFFEYPSEQSFEEMFHTFTPQLIAYFRSRRCDVSLAQDLAQEVMLTVYCKSGQIRDHNAFRGWLFRVARNA